MLYRRVYPTDMTADLDREIIERIPFGRPGSAEEVASVVRSLVMARRMLPIEVIGVRRPLYEELMTIIGAR